MVADRTNLLREDSVPILPSEKTLKSDLPSGTDSFSSAAASALGAEVAQPADKPEMRTAPAILPLAFRNSLRVVCFGLVIILKTLSPIPFH
jgi:hypothetical protein